ncbi:hypothetical protein [Flavobacterium gilvum]|uniref:Uncharacterized protein n=1 Tax=Flavobacterium gilvum TaxID=1492737 RepID=A0AAC9I394_9FLAO|nr:hypothetical protein [Flavobacterium gilvum]AOW08661.1 hypothetical protein EM308_03630 [Flavobacterium gilvum]KFC57902.1 hypothetical protein FEM08_33300 [Flavobacterium gilvum]
MKAIALLFLTIILGNNCQGQKNIDSASAKIEYTANSRGLYNNIVVENKTVFVTNTRNGKPVSNSLTDAQWNALIKEFQKVNLEEIPSLKAPTKKRFHDGAAMANLKITYKGKNYESQTFDNGFPPEKIKNLVNKILSFSKKEE